MGLGVTASKQWKLIEEKLPKATINDRRFSTFFFAQNAENGM